MSKKTDKDEPAGVTGTLADAYGTVADRVTSAYSAARERATGAVEGTAAGIEANPAVALLGGLALGVVAAALIPRSERETALLEPVGARIADAAKAALEVGKTAGATAFADAGLAPDTLREQARTLFEQAIKAAGTAGAAAVGAAREATSK